MQTENTDEKLTPMIKQYLSVKNKYPDSILFFRLGDFYEMFFEDAIEASKLLQITLTARNKGENQTPMCGVPHHAVDGYISKLTKLGKKVAICEQLTDPTLPGIVERDVVRVITPGTTFDENILDQKSNNFIASITKNNSVFSFSYADITTGEFKNLINLSLENLNSEIARISPTEIIIPSNIFEDKSISKIKKSFDSIFFFSFEFDFADKNADKLLINYLESTQKTSFKHFLDQNIDEKNLFMPIDESTLRNLELVSTIQENRKENSLLWVLDHTKTSMGGRLLKHFLLHPLLDKDEITFRNLAVDEFTKNIALLEDISVVFSSIMDIERIISRLSLNRGSAKDLINLKNSFLQIPQVISLLSNTKSTLLNNIFKKLDPIKDISEIIEKSINDESPSSIFDGEIIKDGFDLKLDELRKVSRAGKDFIHNLQKSEIESTGISNLKIRFNKVMGYYIEVSKGQIDKVPEHYIRKQTLVNAERYVTTDLKEYEEKIIQAEEQIKNLELKIFNEVKEKTLLEIDRIRKTSKLLALLDVICSFAFVALKNRYVRPLVDNTLDIEIIEGRHPVVEKTLSFGSFVPNNSILKNNEERLLLITGPNMGGKSTFLRQTALIVLMAQIGSFVPAKSAKIGLVDRIFTRVGASDNLKKGQSTFMLEMSETAFIIDNATDRSLIILDEVGRGTSTYDGMSIAWAIFEYIHDKIGAKTLFATHYHELISLADKLQNGANYASMVSENSNNDITFLYKIVAGGVDKSYGIEVAKLAGLPKDLTDRAKQILNDLEEGVLESGIKKELMDTTKRIPASQIQHPMLVVDENRSHESIENKSALNEIKNIDLDSLTPIEALNKLASIKKNITYE